MALPSLHVPDDGVPTRRVRCFEDLVDAAGEYVGGRNAGLYLFRGQRQMHLVPGTLRETILPALWRSPQPDLLGLLRTIDAVTDDFAVREGDVPEDDAAEALLQHYGVTTTRMLDATQVLHVAATFALMKDWRREPGPAVVHLFGPIDTFAQPQAGHLSAFLVAATVVNGCRRPQRQAAWVLIDPAGRDQRCDYQPHLQARFWIASQDASHFWDGTAPYRKRWLLAGDGQHRLFRNWPAGREQGEPGRPPLADDAGMGSRLDVRGVRGPTTRRTERANRT